MAQCYVCLTDVAQPGHYVMGLWHHPALIPFKIGSELDRVPLTQMADGAGQFIVQFRGEQIPG